MKRTLYAAVAAALLAAGPAVAANQREPMSPREAVAFMQSKYPGEVISLRFDRSPIERKLKQWDVQLEEE
jgi:shikimate kinase